MPVPVPTPILRLIHRDNLRICLQRGGLHSPNTTPNDGRVYRGIHDADVQAKRLLKEVPRGPKGVVHDYVPFYFGFLSPMMLRLKTGRVAGYSEGQRPLIYLVTSAQRIRDSGTQFVFTDGHGLANFTRWFDNLDDLDKVDWEMVYQRYWSDDVTGDNDRQRRKQAEFLVHQFCDWSLITEIAVLDDEVKVAVEQILLELSSRHRPAVEVRPDWYY